MTDAVASCCEHIHFLSPGEKLLWKEKFLSLNLLALSVNSCVRQAGTAQAKDKQSARSVYRAMDGREPDAKQGSECASWGLLGQCVFV